MSRVVHTVEEIEIALRRGMTPETDNREALVELGFARSSPQVSLGYESMIWERSRDRAERSPSGLRLLLRERAVLVGDAAVKRSA